MEPTTVLIGILGVIGVSSAVLFYLWIVHTTEGKQE